MRRTVSGTAAALAGTAALTALMLPLRGSMSTATTALILVVPVVIGVVTGGFTAGAVSVAAGFLVYDFFFIPPYLTLWAGAPDNWAALGVYVAVMLPVAGVVAGMNVARAKELWQGLASARTFVEAHGQPIWAEGAPGGGARFFFTLAVTPATPEEPAMPGNRALP